MTCDCMTEMDNVMREKNTRLSVTFGIPRDGSPMFVRPLISTEKIESRKRGSAALAVPTFCPFCGKRYEPAPSLRGATPPVPAISEQDARAIFRTAAQGHGRAGTTEWPGGPYMSMDDAAGVYAALVGA